MSQRLLTIAAVAALVSGCSGRNEPETGPIQSCSAYCGSLGNLDSRCVKAFGEAHGVARECDAAESADGCESLSAFSPGLASDCVDPPRGIFCCAE